MYHAMEGGVGVGGLCLGLWHTNTVCVSKSGFACNSRFILGSPKDEINNNMTHGHMPVPFIELVQLVLLTWLSSCGQIKEV